MPVSQPTTTPPAKSPLFESPELVLSESVLIEALSRTVDSTNFNTLLSANFLTAMVARDRRLTRDYFEEVLVTSFNLQNRLVRIKELNIMLENLAAGRGFSTTEIKEKIAKHMDEAADHQHKLLQCLSLFQEMRGEGDPVS